MTRIGLTQRVSVIEEYGERRDCLDQEWSSLLQDLGYRPVPLPNRIDAVDEYLDSQELDGIILTSGNDLVDVENPANPARERDEFERAILGHAMDNEMPVLGVCRGLELLNAYFGGSLTTTTGHAGSKHIVEFVDREVEVDLPSQVTVNSYHDYAIARRDVGDELVVLGNAFDGTVECIVHESHPFWGIMWHPERDSPSSTLDRQIINHVFDRTNQ